MGRPAAKGGEEMLKELCPKDGENNEIVIEIRDYEKRLPLILMLMDFMQWLNEITEKQQGPQDPPTA